MRLLKQSFMTWLKIIPVFSVIGLGVIIVMSAFIRLFTLNVYGWKGVYEIALAMTVMSYGLMVIKERNIFPFFD